MMIGFPLLVYYDQSLKKRIPYTIIKAILGPNTIKGLWKVGLWVQSTTSDSLTVPPMQQNRKKRQDRPPQAYVGLPIYQSTKITKDDK